MCVEMYRTYKSQSLSESASLPLVSATACGRPPIWRPAVSALASGIVSQGYAVARCLKLNVEPQAFRARGGQTGNGISCASRARHFSAAWPSKAVVMSDSSLSYSLRGARTARLGFA